MYIENNGVYYDSHGEAHARRGLFLILMHLGYDTSETRACVRKVAMSQMGPVMFGHAWINDEKVLLTGSYGNLGLTREVSANVFAAGIPLPPELYEAWAKGGGHNSAGSEAVLMRTWAKRNLTRLAPEGADYAKDPPYVTTQLSSLPADRFDILTGADAIMMLDRIGRADVVTLVASVIARKDRTEFYGSTRLAPAPDNTMYPLWRKDDPRFGIPVGYFGLKEAASHAPGWQG